MADRLAGSGGADEALIRAVYEQHGQAVLAYAMRLTRDRAAAEDVLQETLIRAWRHPQVLVDDTRPVRPWLFTVANRVVVDRARQLAARPREVAESPMHPPVQPDHAERLIDSMELYEALRTLSEEHRQVVVQLYFRGCSIGEAAAALGVPEGTVKSRLFYAQRVLRKVLKKGTCGGRGGGM